MNVLVPKTIGSSEPPEEGQYNLRLYVAGQTPKSVTALANLKSICETHLAGRYRIEVVDLLENPQLAAGDQILAVPTLVRRLPEPLKRIIGNLSNMERSTCGPRFTAGHCQDVSSKGHVNPHSEGVRPPAFCHWDHAALGAGDREFAASM